MADANAPDRHAETRFKFLVLVFEWASKSLKRIMAAADRDARLPLWERFFASGSGLFVVVAMVAAPSWIYSPNAMYAFADVVSKSPMLAGLPILGFFSFFALVCASLQPLGAFSEHFLRSFLLLPFMGIMFYGLASIMLLVINIAWILLKFSTGG